MASPSDEFKRRNAYFHSLSRTNTEATQRWYESQYKSSHSVLAKEVWSAEIPYCATESEADVFAQNNPTLVVKYTQYDLTQVPGSNGQAWYLSVSGTWMRPWIAPTDVPDETTNNPSNGFEIKLYKQDNSQVALTEGVWIVDYYAGLVKFQEGYTPSDLGWGTPKITCYCYIGPTVESTASGTGCGPDSIITADIDWIEVTSDAPQDFVTLCVVDDDGDIVYGGLNCGSNGGGSNNFTSLSDTPDTYTTSSGKILVVNNAETGIVFEDRSFLGLIDTPSSYSSNADKLLAVQSTESGLNYVINPNLCDVVVDSTSDLQDALNDLAGIGGTIGIKRGTYTLSTQITLPQTSARINIIGEYPVFIRPDSASIFRLDAAVGGSEHVYTFKFLILDGNNKPNNYALISSLTGASTQAFDKLHMIGCIFQNNTYHAFEGRITSGLVVNNSFYDVDGYGWYGGFLGGGTIYSGNNYVNSTSVGTNNSHGFLYSDDGNGIYFQNNTFSDASNSFGHLVYARYAGTTFYCRITNNTFNTLPNNLPTGMYMVYLDNAATNNYLFAQYNVGLGCGVGHECNLVTDTTSPNFIIIENNYCSPN